LHEPKTNTYFSPLRVHILDNTPNEVFEKIVARSGNLWYHESTDYAAQNSGKAFALDIEFTLG
jgi:hypothetical protein